MTLSIAQLSCAFLFSVLLGAGIGFTVASALMQSIVEDVMRRVDFLNARLDASLNAKIESLA